MANNTIRASCRAATTKGKSFEPGATSCELTRSVPRASGIAIAVATTASVWPENTIKGLRTNGPHRPSPKALYVSKEVVSATSMQLSIIVSQTLPTRLSASCTSGFTAPLAGWVIAHVMPASVGPVTSMIRSLPLAPFHLANRSVIATGRRRASPAGRGRDRTPLAGRRC